MKEFYKSVGNLLSMNENNKSSVVIVLLLITGFGIYRLFIDGDIPNNVTTIILTLSSLIFGINSISTVVSGISSKYSFSKTKNINENFNNEYDDLI